LIVPQIASKQIPNPLKNNHTILLRIFGQPVERALVQWVFFGMPRLGWFADQPGHHQHQLVNRHFKINRYIQTTSNVVAI